METSSDSRESNKALALKKLRAAAAILTRIAGKVFEIFRYQIQRRRALLER
jgi:hypothetical protein